MFESIVHILLSILGFAAFGIFIDWLDLRSKIKNKERYYQMKIRDQELEFNDRLEKEYERYNKLLEDYYKLKDKQTDK